MQVKGLDLVLWVIGFLEHIVLFGLLWPTSRRHTFPFFTGLIFVNVLKTIALYLLMHVVGGHSYFYGYWSFMVIDTILQIFVIGEAAVHVFRPVETWVPGSRTSLVALLAVSSIVSGLVTWVAAPTTHLFRQFVVIKGNLFSSILIGELLVGLIVLAATSGLPLKTDAARIIEGLGVFSLVGVVIQGLQAHFGMANEGKIFMTLSQIGISAYLMCLGYWVLVFRKKVVVPRELPDKMREQLLALNHRLAAELRSLQSVGR